MMRRPLVVGLISSLLLSRSAFAAAVPLTDAAFSLVAFNGTVVTGEPVPVTGSLDMSSGTLVVDPFQVFGSEVTSSFELLGPGTYIRDDGNGGTITATVGPGQLGAYIVLDWHDGEVPPPQFRIFNVWDVSNSVYTAVDVDGDGLPGQALQGPLCVGCNAFFEFSTGEPQPVVVELQIPGGATQECSATGGSEVAMTANVQTIEGTSLDQVEWWVDDNSAGTGLSLTPFLALGSHTVAVVATTTTGESASDHATLVIQDTTPPDLILGFLDRSGKPITAISSSKAGTVFVNIEARDGCDSSPTAEGTVQPVYAVFPVQDGDSIRISKPASVELPASALELRGSARDASGNVVGPVVRSLTILN